MRLLVCGLALLALASGSATGDSHRAAPTLAQLVGQKLVVSMVGTTPSASLLARARSGQIGGVLIHRFNFRSSAQLRAIAQRLQDEAAAGGQPRLLIAVDQEGGPVKTVPWIPPTLSPAQLGKLGSAAKARDQGLKTGRALAGLGVNTDFAPVADVPASKASEVYRQGRTWSFDALLTARLAGAFTLGLEDGRAIPAMKHFPGLGFARGNTDRVVVRIAGQASSLEPGLAPYRLAIANRVPLIMLSNAVYDAYDRVNAAGWSRPVATGLLRGVLGYRGAAITDSLDGAARARGIGPNGLAIASANAGVDLILLTGLEATSQKLYAALLRAARSGRIHRSSLQSSYRRILTLKTRKFSPPPAT
jgi:beta-N-acetylhexosaminidase